MQDIVVVLPGILGSELKRDGRDLWAISPSGVFRALLSLGKSIKSLELTGDPAVDDAVVPSRLMRDVHVIPGFWGIDGYDHLVTTLENQLGLVDGTDLFEFPYDWRRDNRRAARLLEVAVEEWLDARRKDHPDARVVFVAHSMGGLVARYYIEKLGGWKDTRALITFGTPFRGSVNALDFTANGFTKKLGPLTIADLSDVLRSLPSVYQLMPLYHCYDPGDGNLVPPLEYEGIPNVDFDMAQDALGFHREIIDAQRNNRTEPGYDYEIYPVVGVRQPTLLSARFEDGAVRCLRTLSGAQAMGDGTVPRGSSIPWEWTDAEAGRFSSARHASLQNAQGNLDQLIGLLDPEDDSVFRKADLPPQKISLDVDPLYEHGEPLTVRAQTDTGDIMSCRVIDVDTGHEVGPVEMLDHVDEWDTTTFRDLPPGVYRVEVGSPQARLEELVTILEDTVPGP